MEADGITRFYHWEGDSRVRETWPEQQNDWMEGEKAIKIINEAEYFAVTAYNAGIVDVSIWRDKPETKFVAEVEVKGLPRSEQLKKVAERIEKHGGQKGFTVRLS